MSEFEDVFADWLIHAVVVKPYLGAGVEGATYGAPVAIGGELGVGEIMVDNKRRLIRGSDGNEMVSETTLYVSVDARPHFTLHSLVTLADGVETTVERVAPMEVYGLFDHVVVNLA